MTSLEPASCSTIIGCLTCKKTGRLFELFFQNKSLTVMRKVWPGPTWLLLSSCWLSPFVGVRGTATAVGHFTPDDTKKQIHKVISQTLHTPKTGDASSPETEAVLLSDGVRPAGSGGGVDSPQWEEGLHVRSSSCTQTQVTSKTQTGESTCNKD